MGLSDRTPACPFIGSFVGPQPPAEPPLTWLPGVLKTIPAANGVAERLDDPRRRHVANEPVGVFWIQLPLPSKARIAVLDGGGDGLPIPCAGVTASFMPRFCPFILGGTKPARARLGSMLASKFFWSHQLRGS
jgi:hypothetical protein